MVRSTRPRLYLVASLLFTFGVLAHFKYAAFLVGTLAPLLEPILGARPPLPQIFLPLGISFYSFQIAGLAIDTYRRQIEPPRSFGRYALFVSFFPQLIAGPILRGSELLPQLDRGGVIDPARTRRGMWLLASGLVKKVLFADFLLSFYVDAVFNRPDLATGPQVLIALYSFAFQIYFDFSGYTDMARGLACLLGFELPLNFEEPYLSRNPAEFWRRWHITLSRWLRDYLYVPLGGNRRGPARTYTNLLLTMLLGGLWHGAGWTFVLWGGLHGLWLAVHRWLAPRRRAERSAPSRGDAWRILLCFHATCLLWLLFRARDLDVAARLFGNLLEGNWTGHWPLLQLGVVLFCAALHPAERWLRQNAERLRALLAPGWGGLVEGAALGVIAALALAVSDDAGEFIYFQF
jgi:D-alanyl-lipoteichoic acid acyltransferase DltB (MBOAT superfamily)